MSEAQDMHREKEAVVILPLISSWGFASGDTTSQEVFASPDRDGVSHAIVSG